LPAFLVTAETRINSRNLFLLVTANSWHAQRDIFKVSLKQNHLSSVSSGVNSCLSAFSLETVLQAVVVSLMCD